MSELAEQCDAAPDQVWTWRGQPLEGAIEVFGGDVKTGAGAPTIDVG